MKDQFDYMVDNIRAALESRGIAKDRCFGKVYRTPSGTKIGLLVILDHSFQYMSPNDRVYFIRDKLHHIDLFHVASIMVLTDQEYQERLMGLLIDQDIKSHL